MNMILKKEIELIRYVRLSILHLTATLSEEQMNLVPDKMKNNLIWNLGHLVFTQQMLCYGLGGLQTNIDTAFFSQFAPDTVPTRHVNAAEILLIREAFVESFNKLAEDIEKGKLQDYKPWKLPTGIAIDNIADAMATNSIHEGRHFGVVISLAKMVS